jgi:hypothetical protein
MGKTQMKIRDDDYDRSRSPKHTGES